MKRFNYIPMAALLATLVSWGGYAQADVVQAYEFNTNADTEGFAVPPSLNISGLDAQNGSLNGTAVGNDPQLIRTGLTISPNAGATWTTFEFRVREFDNETSAFVPVFNPTGLIVQVNGTVISAAAAFANVPSGNDFFTVTVDISGLGTTPLTNFRLDPIGGAASNSNSQTDLNGFEVDYIRLSDNSVAVPEPATFGILGAAGIGMLIRRRRKS